MFIVVIVAVLLGFLVILAMKRVPSPLPEAQRQAAIEVDRAIFPWSLTEAGFQSMCQRLLQELGLDVERLAMTGRRQLEALAVNPAPIVGGLYVVHGQLLQTDEVVDAVDVLALLDAVKGEGASKGVLLTNGFFSDEASQAATHGPIELIDGVRLRELIQHFALHPVNGEAFHPNMGDQSRV